MSSFEIDWSKIRTNSSKIETIYKKINSLKQRLDTCNSALKNCLSSDSYASIKKNLSTVSSNLQQQISNLNRLSNALVQVTTTYSNTEKEIKSQKITVTAVVKADSLFTKNSFKFDINKEMFFSGSLFGAINIAELITSGKISADSLLKDTIISIDDISNLYEKYYDEPLSDGQKSIVKSLYKVFLGKSEIKDVPDMLKFIDKIHKGDYGSAIGFLVDKAGSSLTADGNLNYTGLKIKTVGKTLDLVLKKDSYVQYNDSKYMDKIEKALGNGDILGVVWNGAGNFVQTVGKGTVDVSCQLVSDTIDACLESITGGFITLSGVNALLNDTVGYSPGRLFNDCTKGISKAVDVVLDTSGDFLSAVAKQSYSDLAEFGELMGKAGKGIAKNTSSVVSAIGNLF